MHCKNLSFQIYLCNIWIARILQIHKALYHFCAAFYMKIDNILLGFINFF
jgi:hypothetical protein